ncbi:MAG: T9SS type A sorting domain-containing protein, partial [Ignavibacteriae bacterium]|nr:T9SS type A sorting domain-containing protein [Ignavibacteriota bacterium]
TYNGDGLPVLSWPPAMDLSYSNSYLQTAGTDGLPLGDLNWFPTAKASYLSNKTAIVAALRDSIANAKGLYVPGTPTPMITPGTVDVKLEDAAVPNSFSLEQNYPNPFNPTTSIRFSLPEAGNVTLSIFNALGQQVAKIVDKELKAGSYSYNFDASNLASGVYVYQLSTKNFTNSKKMLLMK